MVGVIKDHVNVSMGPWVDGESGSGEQGSGGMKNIALGIMGAGVQGSMEAREMGEGEETAEQMSKGAGERGAGTTQ